MPVATEAADGATPAAGPRPAVSVVVPVRDGARSLASCLAALLASEGVGELELIVVDDGSRDDTPTVAQRFPCRLLRLAQRQGPAMARNHGARAARATQLVFVDADVIVAPDTLSCLLRALGSAPAAFATYAAEPLHRGFATRFYHALSVQSLRDTDPRTPVAYSYCLAIGRALFDELGGFDARFSRATFEDAELGWRLARRGLLAAHLRDAPVTHAVRYGILSLAGAYFRKSRDLAHLLLREQRLSLGNQGWTRRGNWLTWLTAWGVLLLLPPALGRPWPWALAWAAALVAFVVRATGLLRAVGRAGALDGVLVLVLYLAIHVVATAGMVAGALDWIRAGHD
jgi:GT2 family glycosyltransferase